MLERKRKIAIRLLITGSGLKIPYNPLITLKIYTQARDDELALVGDQIKGSQSLNVGQKFG